MGQWAARVVVGMLIVVMGFVVAGTAWVFVRAEGRVLDADEVAGDPDPVLVLGSLVDDGAPGDYVQGRLDTALALYRDGHVSRIMNSGNGLEASGDEPAVMRAYLEERGVPPGRIIDDPAGFDTDRSCRHAREAFGDQRVIVVTQDFHAARAVALCREYDLDAVAVPALCDCATWTIVRNHVREGLLARPRALITAVTGL